MHLLAATAAATAAVLAGPAFAETKTIELPPFTSVNIASGLNATVTVGGAQSIEAEAPSAEILQELQIRVQNGELQAWVDWNFFDLFNFGASKRELSIRISAPVVTAVEASSGADVDALGVAGDDLKFEASSSADLTASGVVAKSVEMELSSGADLRVTGTCESGRADASSGSDLNAPELLCEKMTVSASSGAGAEVFASASVIAEASSGANVQVHGSPPKVDDETSSGGDVKMVD